MTWILQLNPMTANAERVVPVAHAESREALIAFLEAERVQPYSDGPWNRSFRAGGPLEWFNDPGPALQAWIDAPAIVDIGTEHEWRERGALQYHGILSRCEAGRRGS